MERFDSGAVPNGWRSGNFIPFGVPAGTYGRSDVEEVHFRIQTHGTSMRSGMGLCTDM